MIARQDLAVVGYDMGTAGTIIVDLDYTELISAIALRIKATNGATSNDDNPIALNVSKVELIDGGNVLWSVSGPTLAALGAVQTGDFGDSIFNFRGGASNIQSFVLNFGRFLYDEKYAFNPNAFRNPQLRITFNEATVRAAGATGFVSDSFVLTVLVYLMQDVANPVGMLIAKDIYSWTTAASGDERVDMPVDYPYRCIYVRAYESGVGYTSSLTNIKLDADGGRVTFFDLDTDYLLTDAMNRFPLFPIAIQFVADDADTLELWGSTVRDVAVTAADAGYIVSIDNFTGGRGTLGLKLHDNTAGSAVNGVAVAKLGLPFHTLFIPFGRLDDDTQYLNASAYRTLRVTATQGNAGAVAVVGAQQVYPY